LQQDIPSVKARYFSGIGGYQGACKIGRKGKITGVTKLHIHGAPTQNLKGGDTVDGVQRK
jgi:hypothetical protein